MMLMVMMSHLQANTALWTSLKDAAYKQLEGALVSFVVSCAL